MKSIVFICPYFGKFNKDHMTLWLQSCSHNETINWIIYTDDRTEYDYPNNVEVIYMEFSDFRDKIQEKFDFSISLENPYKLCDFKPTYGYLFEEELNAFDFWGYCDISDTFFGNLRRFFTDEVLENNDKILFWGHMSLYRNNKEVNRRFMLKTDSDITYKEVLSNPGNMCFDERKPYSIDRIYYQYGFSLLRIDNMYADINPLYFRFRIRSIDENYVSSPLDKVKRVFQWKDGKLYEVKIQEDKVCKRELGYIHFQKRKLLKKFDGLTNNYLITPLGYYSCETDIPDKHLIKKFNPLKIIYVKYYILKYKNLKQKLKKMRAFK